MPVHIAIPEPSSPRYVEDSAAYNQRSLPQYLHALYSADVTPIPIPLHESPQRVAKILSTCHGILLPGSPADIDPQKYGEERNPLSAAADAERASIDELLLQDAFHLRKPILGICQGTQNINVWLGGTLIQDIPTQVGTTVNHAPGRTVLEAHPIAIASGTRLAGMAEAIRHENGAYAKAGAEPSYPATLPEYVNSSHHQAIRTAGENLTIAAISPRDNVIEAVELNSPDHFVLAVQWHPERSYNESSLSRAIFAAFVHAAEGHASQSSPSRKMEESVLHA